MRDLDHIELRGKGIDFRERRGSDKDGSAISPWVHGGDLKTATVYRVFTFDGPMPHHPVAGPETSLHLLLYVALDSHPLAVDEPLDSPVHERDVHISAVHEDEMNLSTECVHISIREEDKITKRIGGFSGRWPKKGYSHRDRRDRPDDDKNNDPAYP